MLFNFFPCVFVLIFGCLVLLVVSFEVGFLVVLCCAWVVWFEVEILMFDVSVWWCGLKLKILMFYVRLWWCGLKF